MEIHAQQGALLTFLPSLTNRPRTQQGVGRTRVVHNGKGRKEKKWPSSSDSYMQLRLGTIHHGDTKFHEGITNFSYLWTQYTYMLDIFEDGIVHWPRTGRGQ